MSKDLTTIIKTSEINFTPDQVSLIKNQIAKGATNDELNLFLMQCKRTGLDPFSKQIYSIQRKRKVKNGNSEHWESFMVTQVSIDGFRIIAERSQKYAGQLGPFWCDKDGKWTEVWMKKEPPSAAKVGILRSDFKEPLWGVATWESYAQDNPMWNKMPDVMLAKVAESLALRKSFPHDLSGLYTTEEIEEVDAKPADPKEQTKITGTTVKETTTESINLDSKSVGPSDAVLIPFGTFKGHSAAEVPMQELKWCIDAVKTNIADPKHAKYIAANKAGLVKLETVYMRRLEAEQSDDNNMYPNPRGQN